MKTKSETSREFEVVLCIPSTGWSKVIKLGNNNWFGRLYKQKAIQIQQRILGKKSTIILDQVTAHRDNTKIHVTFIDVSDRHASKTKG